MKAMILSAGRGERMMPLTKETPKPLMRIGDLTLIEHHLLRLKKAGFHEIVINVCYLAEKIIQKLRDGKQYGLSIVYSDEIKTGCLGTGGGIYHALPLLGKDPFLVISADIWTDFPFENLKTFLKNEDLAHLVLVSNPAYHLEGDFDLQKNRIILNSEKPLTYANIGIFRPELFKSCPMDAFPFMTALKPAILENKVSGEIYKKVWYNVGTPEELQALLKITKRM